jgi:uncharacterized protein DUF547
MTPNRREVLRVQRWTATFLAAGLLWAADSASAFDHSHAHLATVLQQHVTNGLVHYSALKQEPKDLQAYLNEMNGVEEPDFKQWKREEQLAFLINLYNASILKLIIDHYPIKSVKDVGGWFGRPWDVEIVPLFGKIATLSYLEHEMLRKFNEPRIHFALVCGARGCPELRAEPYVPDKLDAQLTEQGRKFIRDRTKNRVEAAERALYLSPIFKWFADDFTRHSGSVVKFVQIYRPDIPSLQWKIRYTDYNWLLNDSSGHR